ncbi:hypothetical protein K470DRAFT_131272 [Piedraia hortae CBS 480.64]|uniref:Uncharacterized protein n=1 Tax=Piedraia hortae CBS 480.64 TaxID=1314780 RepID=A0A6A7BTD1_9PEZI|nr:hypothetical protein K470DRAFT_131272 [Piedraia hortae CBS 480.64]
MPTSTEEVVDHAHCDVAEPRSMSLKPSARKLEKMPMIEQVSLPEADSNVSPSFKNVQGSFGQRSFEPGLQRSMDSDMLEKTGDSFMSGTPFATPTPAQKKALPVVSFNGSYVQTPEDHASFENTQAETERMSDSSESGDDLDDGALLTATQSVDVTPFMSRAVSPASSRSNGGKTAHADTDQSKWDDFQLPKQRGGRRRKGQHHIPEVEIALRRQLELRTAYRGLMRALKPVAAEVADRTLIELETNPTSHEEATEHPGVIAGLDAALERRRAEIHTQRELTERLLHETLEAESSVTKRTFSSTIRDLQDAFLDKIERDIVVLDDEVRRESDSEGDATDLEDGVFPRPRRMGYGGKKGSHLDKRYHSRSLPAMEAEIASEQVGSRFKMRQMLRVYNYVSPPDPIAYTIFDKSIRDAGIARSKAVDRTKTLAAATAVVEKPKGIVTTKNLAVEGEAAVALQVLGDLALQLGPLPPRRNAAASQPHPFFHSQQMQPHQSTPTVRLQSQEEVVDDCSIEMSPRTRAIFQEHLVVQGPPTGVIQRRPTLPSTSPDLRREDKSQYSDFGWRRRTSHGAMTSEQRNNPHHGSVRGNSFRESQESSSTTTPASRCLEPGFQSPRHRRYSQPYSKPQAGNGFGDGRWRQQRREEKSNSRNSTASLPSYDQFHQRAWQLPGPRVMPPPLGLPHTHSAAPFEQGSPRGHQRNSHSDVQPVPAEWPQPSPLFALPQGHRPAKAPLIQQQAGQAFYDYYGPALATSTRYQGESPSPHARTTRDGSRRRTQSDVHHPVGWYERR